MPPRRSGVRRNVRAARWFSGIRPRAKLRARAGDVGVDVDAAGKDDHAGRVDRAAAASTSATMRPSRDADVLDDAVDAVGRIVDLPAGDPQHGVPWSI